ncbi:hypothetical protein AgCh_024676 [Apium graveolens]
MAETMSGTKSVAASLVSAGTGPSVSSMIPKALDAGPGAGASCAVVALKPAKTVRIIKTMSTPNDPAPPANPLRILSPLPSVEMASVTIQQEESQRDILKNPLTCDADTVCLTCPMAKFAKLPFPTSESRSTKAFELIHTDIWDYLKTLEVFYNYAQTQFNASIQVVRSDNALEFKDTGCRAFFQSHGIVYQTSCAYRPQQNARVERKQRHLLEVAHPLMF